MRIPIIVVLLLACSIFCSNDQCISRNRTSEVDSKEGPMMPSLPSSETPPAPRKSILPSCVSRFIPSKIRNMSIRKVAKVIVLWPFHAINVLLGRIVRRFKNTQ